MPPTALVAIGGHALVGAGVGSAMGADRSRVEAVCGAIADMVADGWRVVVTHGNGPQVGAALLRSEAAPPEVYPLALDVCVASTQGEIGFLLQPALAEALEAKGLRRPVATLLTQVVVDQSDPAFAHPTKPIGPHYSRSEAAVRQARGWVVIEQPHGWRRVVPSPEPVAIVEEGVIRAMVDAGVLVVALGGGGIPVVRQGRRFVGVEAVIDKDLSSALLATRLRMDRLALVTNVDRAYLEFGAPTARGLDGVTAEDLQRHAGEGHFAPGSMSPKVDAALRFVRAGGGESIVTSYEELAQALQGRAGTRVRLASHPAAGPHDRPGVQQVDR